MIWIIIGAVALVLIIVLAVFLSSKKKKKRSKKLDESISKLQNEKAQIDQKQQADEAQRKEDEAFKNITLTEDVEDEFKDLFTPPPMEAPEEEDFDLPDFEKVPFKSSGFDDDFFKKIDQQPEKPKTRDEEFEEFMNQHSFSRRVLDNEILGQIRKLPPKVKAIILGNIFNKFEQ